MILDGKRKQGFYVWRSYGSDKNNATYWLILIVNSQNYPDISPRLYGAWNIPLHYGGKLATTAPKSHDCYSVSQRKLPEHIVEQVRKCISHIEEHGTPMENDEHVYSEVSRTDDLGL